MTLSVQMAALALALLMAAPALAEASGPACPVRLIPTRASGPWVLATRELQRSMSATAERDRDCAEIVVRTSSSPVSVEVTTTDGRRGVRPVLEAADLEATATALVLTLPEDLRNEPQDEVAPKERAAASAPAAPLAATMVSAPARKPPNDHGWRLLLVAGGSARFARLADRAPAVELTIGATAGSWELTAFGAWLPRSGPRIVQAPQTTPMPAAPEDPSPPSPVAVEAGLGAAHRFALDRVSTRLEAFVGARASALVGRSTAGRTNGMFSGEMMDSAWWVAPSLTLTAGASIGLFSRLRVRPQVAAQWVATNLASAAVDSPPWIVGLGLGVESRVP